MTTTGTVPSYIRVNGEIVHDDEAELVEELREIMHEAEVAVCLLLDRRTIDFTRSEQGGHLKTDIEALISRLEEIGR